MTKYYIVPTGSHTHGHYHIMRSWAALDNPDGTSLLSVTFHDDECCERFEAHDCVQPLTTSGCICAAHSTCLNHLGVVPTDTLKDVVAKVRQVYKAM